MTECRPEMYSWSTNGKREHLSAAMKTPAKEMHNVKESFHW